MISPHPASFIANPPSKLPDEFGIEVTELDVALRSDIIHQINDFCSSMEGIGFTWLQYEDITSRNIVFKFKKRK